MLFAFQGFTSRHLGTLAVGKRFRVYTIVAFSFIRTFAP